MNSMRKYAILKNSTIVDIQILDETNEDLIRGILSSNEQVIDIDELIPVPVIGWVLNGNKLEMPQGYSSREEYEIELAEKKVRFGFKLADICIIRIGARNKILNKNGTQVGTLLNQLLPVKLLLETGALGTARYSCIQLKTIYTEYVDIFDYVINEINVFEKSTSL